MAVVIRTGVSEFDQMTEFQNATLQGSDDGSFVFSISTHISGLSATTEEDFAAELRTLLTLMAEAVWPVQVDFEAEIGASE